MQNFPLLEVKNIHIIYKKTTAAHIAVSNVSFNLYKGETLALVGESGCGKSSIAKALLGILKLSSGSVTYKGTAIDKYSSRMSMDCKKDIQMIFQDPYSSLNPRMTVEEIIKEPLLIYKMGDKKSQKKRTSEILSDVGLPACYKHRYPHELSGGERQRVSIARALISKPKVLICDEPTHALDTSVQASIINLLKDLRDEYDLSILFISHDLSLVKNLSDRCLVMYAGEIIEKGPCEAIFNNPMHPFTKSLLSAIPIFGQEPPPCTYPEKCTEYFEIPINSENRALPNCVKELQSSIATAFKKKKIPECRETNLCPYLSKCKERKTICSQESTESINVDGDHSYLCHLRKKVERP